MCCAANVHQIAEDHLGGDWNHVDGGDDNRGGGGDHHHDDGAEHVADEDDLPPPLGDKTGATKQGETLLASVGCLGPMWSSALCSTSLLVTVFNIIIVFNVIVFNVIIVIVRTIYCNLL